MLSVSTRKFGSVVTLCPRGRIVVNETVALERAVGNQTEASLIVLDLATVTAIDAHGLGILLALRQQAQSKGIELRLVNVSRLIWRVLEITRLNSVFDVKPQPDVPRQMPLARSPGRKLAACA
jgi:anti-anti-sigma factor